MLVFEYFHLFLPTTTVAAHQLASTTITMTEDRPMVRENGCASPILPTRYVFPSNIVNISVLIQFYYPQPKSLPLPPTFSLVAGWPSHHPRKRAHMLVFDGGGTAFNTTTPSLSKTSRYARFRRWLVVFHHHNSITFENEHTRSFSKVT